MLGNGIVGINDTEFTMYMTNEEIVAMPYIDSSVNNDEKLYCTDVTSVLFDLNENDVPEIYPGIVGVEYPDDLTNVPIRLGLRHIESGKSLTIPIRTNIKYAVEENEGMENHSLILNENNTSVYLMENADEDISQNPTKVGNVTKLFAKNGENNNSLTIEFEHTYTFEEGKKYTLYIPFSESGDGETILGNACDGWARLQIKVVPEYLTWQETGKDWYNESTDAGSWKQSNEAELYMGTKNESQDVNGNDDVTAFTYSPLYFTKITVLDGKELPLVDPTTDANGTSTVANIGNIKYEMAIDTVRNSEAKYQIKPYYINKVEQIYFKPEATLFKQHYLDYQKAWVEFTLERNKPYWMASPLRAVYAGDMYAPYATGKQETPAFEDIEFSYKEDSPYHRWKLPFYQKAWNKAVAYSMIENPTLTAAVADGTNVVGVSAVKSNWSIEYNDVWVPYSIGKGFYMRVDEKEDDAVTVRLPKADKEYTYQQTKAGESLHPVGDRTEAGLLATSLNNATVEVDLTKVNGESATDVEAGEARHFLVGNPYMTYLNMGEFLKVNSSILNNKYWTLANDAPTAVVGTPDVPFTGDDGTLGSVSGTVKPMEAFFIEVKPNVTDEQLKVTFTEAMMSDTEIEATSETKAASFAATNPTLTITAERGETRSVAKLLTSDKAENGYRASEDAVVLLDSELDAPMVYTVAGSRAAQVNAVKKISNIGLGVYNAGDDEVTITISGISRMATPLYLYDAATRQSTRLEGDSYELRVSGDSHGRYYLRNSAMADELENTISIYSARPGEVIVSALQPVKDIRVFALNGAQVRRFSVNTTRYTFTLPAGIYMIQATDGERGQTEKVLVR